MQSRLAEISKLLAVIAPEVQGINRYRYARSMSCVEELIEALTFAHYLRTQSLMGYTESVDTVAALSTAGTVDKPAADAAVVGDDAMDVDAGAAGTETAAEPATNDAPAPALPAVHVTEQDYLGGIFDLSGEMMRFATTSAALNGTLDGAPAPAPDPSTSSPRSRTIVADMQELGSIFEILPQQHGKFYQRKLETLRQSVLKVEMLGYGLKVRGSERPAGWMPDTSAGDGDGPLRGDD